MNIRQKERHKEDMILNKIELLKQIVERVENSNPSSLGNVVNTLEENGIENNMHVGKPRDFFDTDEKVAEWYLGQYLNIIDKESWYAMNSLINQSYSWVQSR